MIHLPTTETPGRRRRHIHKQARLVLPQTVLLRIVPLVFFVFPVPLIQMTAAHFSEGWFPEMWLLQVVSAAWLGLMPPPLLPPNLHKTNGGSL